MAVAPHLGTFSTLAALVTAFPPASTPIGAQAFCQDINGLVQVNGTQTAYNSVSGEVVINPSGDTTGATDYAAINAYAANNVVIRLLPGVYYCNASITFTGYVSIIGAGACDADAGGLGDIVGAGNSAATSVIFGGTSGSATINGFVFTKPGAVIRDVHIRTQTTALATAGAGIVLQGAHGAEVVRCSVYGFAVAVQSGNATADCFVPVIGPGNKFIAQSLYGVVFNSPAEGENDGLCIGNWFSSGPAISSNFTGTLSSGTLTVTGLTGTIAIGQTLYAASVTAGTTITGGSGSTWTTSGTQTLGGSQTMQTGAASTPQAGIFAVNASGLKIQSNKMTGTVWTSVNSQRYLYCIWHQPTLAAQQEIFMINDNSLEGCYSHCVFLDGSQVTSGSNVWLGVSIVGNELVGGDGVFISGSSHLQWGNINIDANFNPYNAGDSFYVNAYQFCSNVNVGSFAGYAAAGIVIAQGDNAASRGYSTCNSINFDISKLAISYATVAPAFVVDYSSSWADSSQKGNQIKRLGRYILSGMTSGVAKQHFQIAGLPSFGNGFRVKATLGTNLPGIGGYVVVAERALTSGSSGGSLTAATIGTDYNNSTSANIIISFDTSTTAGSVYVNLTIGASVSSSPLFNGTLEIDVSGICYQVIRL